ncbi:hypothetical protein AAHE18_11G075100 [Arachis hypogaea]|nr:uncharacterized protein DS421_11g326840 [Arachis hypogaea]
MQGKKCLANLDKTSIKQGINRFWRQIYTERLLRVGHVVSVISTAVAVIVEVKRRNEGTWGGIGDARPGEENRRLSRCGEAMGMRDRRRENGSGDGQVEWGFRDLRSGWKGKEKRKMWKQK